MTSKDIVWPFRVPPGSTFYWNEQNWHDWIAKFRPEGYTGGMYDTAAWEAWKKVNHETALRAFLARHDRIEE